MQKKKYSERLSTRAPGYLLPIANYLFQHSAEKKSTFFLFQQVAFTLFSRFDQQTELFVPHIFYAHKP